MTKRGFARLPGRGDAGRTELAERLLASQGKFAEDVLRATTPLLPGKGDTGTKKSGGETKQASPSRRADGGHEKLVSLDSGPGPPPAIGPLPAASDRGSPQTCLPS